MAVRQYKASGSSLENFRHSLNRYLNAPPPHNKNIDLIKDVEFRKSNENFKSALKELKEAGLGSTDHIRYGYIENKADA
jgi:hypothetical protein